MMSLEFVLSFQCRQLKVKSHLKWWKNIHEFSMCDWLFTMNPKMTFIFCFYFFLNHLIKVWISAKQCKAKMFLFCYWVTSCYCISCLFLVELNGGRRWGLLLTVPETVGSVIWLYFIMWLLIKAKGSFSNLKVVFITPWAPVLGWHVSK